MNTGKQGNMESFTLNPLLSTLMEKNADTSNLWIILKVLLCFRKCVCACLLHSQGKKLLNISADLTLEFLEVTD